MLIEMGYFVVGIDVVIKNIVVLKGLFYYCFKSKEVFGFVVFVVYGDFFVYKLDKFLLDDVVLLLEWMVVFVCYVG